MNMTEGPVPDHSSTTTPPTRPARRRGPWRWLVAGLATLLLVVSGSGLIAFAQTGAGEGRGPAFVPADAPIYLEARIDMPDGQDAALAELLTAFPGFADSASFQLRIDEALDAAVSDATGGELSFSEDISPWITGEIGLALMDLGAAMASDAETPPMLLGVGVSDAAAASAFVDTLVAESGMMLTEEDHGGFGVISGEDAAIAVTDDFLLIGTGADLVKQGIDVLGGAEPSLAEDAAFQTAFARVPAGHLGAVWADFTAFGDLISAAMAMSQQPGPGQMTEQLLSQLPQDMTAYVAAAPNGVTIEAFLTPAEGTPALAMGESDLALAFPADTQLYVEVRDLGSTFQTALEGLTTTMGVEASEELEPIEDALRVPLPQLLDFVDDAAMGGSVTSDGLWLGVAGEVNDPAAAAERLDRILTLVSLATSSEDAEVTISESDIDGTTVTTITLPPDVEMGSMSIGDSVSVALSDDGRLLLGTGDFVTEALTSDGTDSLGTSERYTTALGDATANAGVVFADIAGLLTTLDPLLSFMMDDWDEISPWVGGLDRFVAVSTASDEVISARVTLFVD